MQRTIDDARGAPWLAPDQPLQMSPDRSDGNSVTPYFLLATMACHTSRTAVLTFRIATMVSKYALLSFAHTSLTWQRY